MKTRTIQQVITATRAVEGAGFVVRRPFPTATLDHFDPFLLLDHFGPVVNAPGEAVGAPDHPHRGFETVSYLLEGAVEHRDSQGNHGRLGAGDVQWMTAGAGVIHSETPPDDFQREGGRTHGFQLWVNLPARDKMMKPRYQDVTSDRIPVATSADGRARVKVVAGESMGAKAVIETRTPIIYLHFTLQPGGRVVQPVPASYNAFAYVVDGAVEVGDARRAASEGQSVMFEADADEVVLSVPEDAPAPANVLLLAGVPLREPVARYGPFVMNTREEIVQAFQDYRGGRLGRIDR